MKTGIHNNITGSESASGIEIHRKRILINALIFPGMIATLALGILAMVEGDMLLGIFDFVICLCLLGLNFFLRLTGNTTASIWTGLVLLFVFFIFLTADGGIENTAILWILSFPMLTVFLLGTKKGVALSLLFLLAVFLIFIFKDASFIRSRYPIVFQIRISTVYAIICILSVISENLRLKIHNKLQQSNAEKEKVIQQLNSSIEEIRKLQDILPICVHCKKIRDDKGYWQAVEEYLSDRTEAQFSHALCPECASKYYPDYIGNDTDNNSLSKP